MVIDTIHEIETLKEYEKLSADAKNHKQLLKSKEAILYAAILLDNEKATIINLCLDIFENLIANKNNHVALISTFGVYESLQALCIRMRNADEKIFHRASEITEILRNAAPPAFRTRSRAKGGEGGGGGEESLKKQTVYLLYTANLTLENRQLFENTLIKIKGVVSFLIDMHVKRCTLRICPKVTIKEVVEKIFGKSGLKCLVVRKNKEEQREDLYDVILNTPNRSYMEYPEEDFLQRSGAVATATADRTTKSGFLSSVAQFWNESFYW